MLASAAGCGWSAKTPSSARTTTCTAGALARAWVAGATLTAVLALNLHAGRLASADFMEDEAIRPLLAYETKWAALCQAAAPPAVDAPAEQPPTAPRDASAAPAEFADALSAALATAAAELAEQVTSEAAVTPPRAVARAARRSSPVRSAVSGAPAATTGASAASPQVPSFLALTQSVRRARDSRVASKKERALNVVGRSLRIPIPGHSRKPRGPPRAHSPFRSRRPSQRLPSHRRRPPRLGPPRPRQSLQTQRA